MSEKLKFTRGKTDFFKELWHLKGQERIGRTKPPWIVYNFL